ncbi:30371_t:CDS:2, partial [Gigaspora margarita]
MNITIDSLCVSEKSVVGRLLAKQLGFMFVNTFTSSKEFVVAGRNASINIIPDTDIKIVLTANLTIRIARRYLENYDDY